jgi:hypothetical protein
VTRTLDFWFYRKTSKHLSEAEYVSRNKNKCKRMQQNSEVKDDENFNYTCKSLQNIYL